MSTNVLSKIEESILTLPISEQRRLIARVSKTLRKRDDAERDARLEAMAKDLFIQQEIREIGREFAATEMDGLAE